MTTSRKDLFGGDAPWSKQDWTASDDRVRSGSSTSYLSIRPSTIDAGDHSSSAFFHGYLNITTLGKAGFASQRNTTSMCNWHLAQYDGLEVTVGKSDGKQYCLVVKDEMRPKRPDGREQSSLSWEFNFEVPATADTESKKQWTVLRARWSDFLPTYRGRPKEGLNRHINVNDIKRISFMMRSLFGKQSGPFEIEIKSISAFKEVAENQRTLQQGQDANSANGTMHGQEARPWAPPESRDSADSFDLKPAKDEEAPTRRERRRNPIIRVWTCCFSD